MNLPADASKDQSNCPPDYYRRNNGMLHQLQPEQPVNEVKPLSDDELRLMARDKLSALLQSLDAKSNPSLVLAVAREVMDRIEGKPMQRIKQDTTVSFDLKANSALLNRFREKLGVKDTIVIDGTTGSSGDNAR
jgi:type IV pilus biogenesis protein CpaD/CtpE